MVQLIHNRVAAALPEQCPVLGTPWRAAPLTEGIPTGMATALILKQEQMK